MKVYYRCIKRKTGWSGGLPGQRWFDGVNSDLVEISYGVKIEDSEDGHKRRSVVGATKLAVETAK